MTRVKLLAVALMAVCTTAAFASGAASAALPEFRAADVGKSLPGTIGKSILETLAGSKVSCTAGSSSGTIANVTEVSKIRLVLTGCASFGFACNSPGAASGEIKAIELTGKLGYITKKTEVGLRLRPSIGAEVAEFECVGGTVQVLVTGLVIGLITPINKASEIGELTFRQKAGMQEVTRFEGEKASSELFTSINGGVAEASGFEATLKLKTIKAGETFEIRA